MKRRSTKKGTIKQKNVLSSLKLKSKNIVPKSTFLVLKIKVKRRIYRMDKNKKVDYNTNKGRKLHFYSNINRKIKKITRKGK